MAKAVKIEGGQGGKLGHGNMAHWDLTENIKKETKKLRRAESKRLCKEANYDS